MVPMTNRRNTPNSKPNGSDASAILNVLLNREVGSAWMEALRGIQTAVQITLDQRDDSRHGRGAAA